MNNFFYELGVKLACEQLGLAKWASVGGALMSGYRKAIGAVNKATIGRSPWLSERLRSVQTAHPAGPTGNVGVVRGMSSGPNPLQAAGKSSPYVGYGKGTRGGVSARGHEDLRSQLPARGAGHVPAYTRPGAAPTAIPAKPNPYAAPPATPPATPPRSGLMDFLSPKNTQNREKLLREMGVLR